jgi:hypothetical protein
VGEVCTVASDVDGAFDGVSLHPIKTREQNNGKKYFINRTPK